jgi:hypothetical protein
MPDPGETKGAMKIVGKRRASHRGLEDAKDFLDLVIELRAGKPFIPKGVWRFRSFEEKDEWTMKMLTR